MEFNPISYQVERKESGLTPIHPDGCMIMVWTEGAAKRLRTAQERNCMQKNVKAII